MQLGCSLPVADIGSGVAVMRDYAQAAEGLGYGHLVAPDHVLGANRAPGCTQQIGFAVGVLILAQRQAVLVAKQAASLDQSWGGRFWLGIGIGWNEIEFIGLNENFRNRGKRSAEQVRVMQALWAEPHVRFTGEFHRIDDAGINPCPPSDACRSGTAGTPQRLSGAVQNTATATCRSPIPPARPHSARSPSCEH
jgi:alkanesulfonate monooxygenase SsuD/methylene tetrahydromethanopterin reductase-like flavin-dependent oxidoreductase (luciferase family)